MASNNPSMENTVPRCLKHHRAWQTRVQQLLNKMRDTLIPKIYINRINNLLCSCGKGYVAARPNMGGCWEEVRDAQLQQAITFIDNHIMQNIGNPHVPILKKVMEWMRKDKEINPENSTDPPPAPRSSALKLLYILQKAIEKDFGIMEPHKIVPVQQSKKKMRREVQLTIQLEDYAPELLGQLVGSGGSNIMTFMKQEKCHVCFETVSSDGNEKVMATIKKTTEDGSVLENISEELKKFAKKTQDEILSYVSTYGEGEITPEVLSVIDEVDQMNPREMREEFTELIEAADIFGPSSQFNDITTHYKINPNARYKAVTRKMPVITQIRTFNDAKKQFASAISLAHTASQISSLSIGRSVRNENPTAVTVVADSNFGNTIPKSVASSDSAVNKVIQSAASSAGGATNQVTGGATNQMTGGATNQMTGIPTVVNAIDPYNLGADDPCPTNCLVHDRRWVSTYQYTLTQCYTHIRLPRKKGSRFSRLICTCDKPRPEARLYFVVEHNMVKAFDQCKEKIGRWPQACRTIMKPLITQLEKYDKSEVWHSLFKFVFYFASVDSISIDVLNYAYRLPGKTTAYVPRQEKPYFYQANVPIAIIQPNRSTATQSTASSLGASCTSISQSDAGASGISIFQSSNQQQSSPSETRLKRLCPDDWIDDCYYHGKKKKFVFQCVINYLHKHAGLPIKLNIPYSMAVCVCDEKIEFKDFYKSEEDCRVDCRSMRSKLDSWRGDSKSSIQPYMKLLEEYINHKQKLTDGFLKVVYHFNQVYRREMKLYEELHNLVKKQRNKTH